MVEWFIPISDQVDIASPIGGTETLEVDLIPGRVKPKTIKIGFHNLRRSAFKNGICEAFHHMVDR